MADEYRVALAKGRKYFFSENYKYVFDLKTGFFIRWGRDKDDDPAWSPFGPEIFDFEVADKCFGLGTAGVLCPYCYKSNTHEGNVISYEDFKAVIENVNFSDQLTQVALGTGSHGIEDPGIFDKSEWLRSQNIIPNGTVADITEDTARNIAQLWGAAAVSYHTDKTICYANIELLSSYLGQKNTTLQQVNMHLVVYEENYNDVMGILWDIRHNQQLKKLNAVVFLTLKNKGRAAGLGFTPLTQEHYTAMVTYCLNPDHHISFGSDSCGCHKVEAALKGMPQEDAIKTMTDPCESGLFSGFANAKGIGFPCSFMEGIEPGITLLTHDFQEYWTIGLAAWRTKLLAGKRHCPHYHESALKRE